MSPGRSGPVRTHPGLARWGLTPLALSMFLIGSAEVIAGPMMTYMGGHFGVPVAKVAWLPASYALVYSCCAPVLGPLSDRVGRKALLVPALLGFGAGMGLVALAPSFALALVGGACAGLCAAIIQPNALSVINDTLEVEAQAAATGRVFMGLTLSFVVTPVVSSFVASRLDWRAAYLLVWAAAVVAAVLSGRLPVGRPSAGEGPGFLEAFRVALGIHTVKRRLAASFLWVGLAAGTTALLAEILRRRFLLEPEATGLLAGVFGLATVAGNLLVGVASRRAGLQRRVLAGGVLATAVGCVVVGVLPPVSVVVSAGAVTLWALGLGVAGPIHHSTLGGISGRVRGTITALNASLLNLGIVAFTYGAGRFFDALGVEVVVGAATLGMFGALALLMTIPPEGRSPPAMGQGGPAPRRSAAEGAR